MQSHKPLGVKGKKKCGKQFKEKVESSRAEMDTLQSSNLAHVRSYQ